jgi:hypothetical protein
MKVGKSGYEMSDGGVGRTGQSSMPAHDFLPCLATLFQIVGPLILTPQFTVFTRSSIGFARQLLSRPLWHKN